MIFTQTFIGLTVPALFLAFLNSRSASAEPLPLDEEDPHKERGRHDPVKYRSFRNKYLLVYCLVMAGDWLQGPYIYALYKSHGLNMHDISLLFMTGYLSSALFGALLGSIADNYGRKRVCLWFTLLYSLSSTMATFPVMGFLFVGKVLAGISTSLLYSIFESWMVSQHFKEGFSPFTLAKTFSWATYLNGITAISCGLFADTIVDIFGEVAPFYAAVGCFGLGAALITIFWNENYGGTEVSFQFVYSVLTFLPLDHRIALVGAVQALFEGAMFSIISLWGPILEAADGTSNTLPFGIIFSSFMVSMMIGSSVFQLLTNLGWNPKTIGKITFFISGAALISTKLISVRQSRNSLQPGTQNWIFFCFNIFEFGCGMYYPMIGTLRSAYIPEESRSTIMNFFTIPWNVYVVFILLAVRKRVKNHHVHVESTILTRLVVVSVVCFNLCPHFTDHMQCQPICSTGHNPLFTFLTSSCSLSVVHDDRPVILVYSISTCCCILSSWVTMSPSIMYPLETDFLPADLQRPLKPLFFNCGLITCY
ncbi:DUF791-domain-containing protein [Basidiobolus meristosporus CBS 931.73]|uniref:Molybdate-anion transporter n=1 Tax=Basidiobolus meristosporus CBS 931.73 TaxID=1314790 RepID=A0A1Y1XT18_9FUNG|nr:DUF791-domain-containing protein [Basidiobolus meristosporus CBS 931.73]|eukprot:ORX88880.1 DUF791-domain-containing protein [Basidiobolus meristosporus CBS 931.73]